MLKSGHECAGLKTARYDTLPAQPDMVGGVSAGVGPQMDPHQMNPTQMDPQQGPRNHRPHVSYALLARTDSSTGHIMSVF